MEKIFKSKNKEDNRSKLCPKCVTLMIPENKGKVLIYSCSNCNMYLIDEQSLSEIVSNVNTKFERDPMVTMNIEKPING